MTEHLLGRADAGASALALSRRGGVLTDYDYEARHHSDFGGTDAADHSSLKILNVLRIIVRHRWLFLAVLAACVILGALRAYMTTPLYRATATLELNSAPQKVVQTNNQSERPIYDDDFLALQVGLIKSRAIAERVARTLNLGSNEKFLGAKMAGTVGEKAAVSRLMGGFSAAGTASDRLLRIDYVHPDPQVAAQVINGYATGFIEGNIERQFQTTAFTRKYLEQRLAATRAKLEKSEADLMAYSRQANILNIVSNDPEGASSSDAAGTSLVASNLMALNQQLGVAQNARIVAQQKYQQAAGAVGAARASNPVVQSLQQQRAILQANYDKELQTMREDHPTMIALRSQINALTSQMSQAAAQSTSSTAGTLRSDYLAAVNAERMLEGKIRQLEQSVMNLGDRSIKYNILKRDVEANRNLYNSLLQRLKEEDTSATKDSNVAIVDLAEVPGAPFVPNTPRTLILSLLAGLVLGSLAAIGQDYIEDTINTPEDVTNRLDLPVLGVIPLMKKGENVDELLGDPSSILSEAFYSVRTALQFSTAEGLPKSLFITSSRAGEGKTSSALALATNLAMTGINVLLIDADLRNPSLLPETREKVGLAGLLTRQGDAHSAIMLTEIMNLSLLPAGPSTPNPATLLAGTGLRDLIEQMGHRFDVIVVDGPPVLGLADAPLISSVCDATILIIEAGKTRRTVAANSIARLRMAGANVTGGILNKYKDEAFGYGTDYGYGYGGSAYAYGQESKLERKAPKHLKLKARQPE
jgi:capsular exopolysaccharide synthesis family protein